MPHEAMPQDAMPQDAMPHEASDSAVMPQLAASNTGALPPSGSGTTNAFSARFGLGGADSASAAAASTTPTPSEYGLAAPGTSAVSISAPLTWSGVQPGCAASRSAAMPATSGAENDVPESCR